MQRRRTLAVWQTNLRHLSPRFADDIVRDALVVRACRVLLLTDRHVVYCKAKSLGGPTAEYKVRWRLCLQDVNNVLCAPPMPAP